MCIFAVFLSADIKINIWGLGLLLGQNKTFKYVKLDCGKFMLLAAPGYSLWKHAQCFFSPAWHDKSAGFAAPFF